MKDLNNLRRLAALAALRSETELARLSAAIAARDRTAQLIDGLDAVPSGERAGDAPALQNAAAYSAWAARRRAALRQRLDAEEGCVTRQRVVAARAFGIARALASVFRNAAARPPASRDG